VLLRQALREVREVCDSAMARQYAARLAEVTVRCRWLSAPSPFARAWTQEMLGAVESPGSPAEALQRLHAQLTAG